MVMHLAPISPPPQGKVRWWHRLNSLNCWARKTVDGNTSGGTGDSEQPPEQEVKAESRDEPPHRRRKYAWTRTHSFYAVMGGFAFDNSDNAEAYPMPGGRTRLTLLPPALVFLAEFRPDLIPDVSQAAIQDKSKSMGITKVVAFWQALWFTLQFVTRLAQGLKVSMLELNTLLHVACALVSYFGFWFNKPLDIMEASPIAVDDRETAELCAAMSLLSHIGRPGFRLRRRRGFGFNGGIAAVSALINSPTLASGEVDLRAAFDYRDGEDAGGMTEQNRGLAAIVAPQLDISQLPTECTVRYRRIDPLFRCDWQTRWELQTNYDEMAPAAGVSVVVPRPDLRRFHLGLHALVRYDDLLRVALPSNFLHLDPELVAPRAGNLNYDAQLLAFDKYRPYGTSRVRFLADSPAASIAGFAAASAVYGGAHLLLGWNGPMATTAEVLLWRVSGVALAAFWAVLVALFAAAALPLVLFTIAAGGTRPGQSSIAPTWLRYAFPAYLALVLVALGAVLALFLLARVYVVVECFVSLWYAPQSVFAQPVWSSYVFHI